MLANVGPQGNARFASTRHPQKDPSGWQPTAYWVGSEEQQCPQGHLPRSAPDLWPWDGLRWGAGGCQPLGLGVVPCLMCLLQSNLLISWLTWRENWPRRHRSLEGGCRDKQRTGAWDQVDLTGWKGLEGCRGGGWCSDCSLTHGPGPVSACFPHQWWWKSARRGGLTGTALPITLTSQGSVPAWAQVC